jgi:hypothetical protein
VEEERVVLDTVCKRLPGRLAGVEETVPICKVSARIHITSGKPTSKENLDVDASSEEVGNLHKGHAVGNVGCEQRSEKRVCLNMLTKHPRRPVVAVPAPISVTSQNVSCE